MTTSLDLPADAEPLTADDEPMTAAAPGSTLLRIQLRRDTADAWTAANPVLGAGEQGLETDTGKQKVGNGANAWVDLPYEVSRPDLALKANASTVAAKQDKATLGADAATALQTPGNALYVAGRAALVPRPAGGSDGQVLVKVGSDIAWGDAASGGYDGGTL